MSQAVPRTAETLEARHQDPILIGYDKNGKPVEFVSGLSNNHNHVYLGGSGSGKTRTLHHMVANVFARGTTFHVIDIKGDFGYEHFEKSGVGHLVSPADFNDIRFNLFDGASLNPLQVPRMRESGGVMMAIENTKELVKSFSGTAGQKQLRYLGEILAAVYKKKNIDHDIEESWANTAPTLIDVLDEIDLVFNVISSGLGVGTVEDVMKMFRKSRAKADSRIAQMLGDEHGDDEIAYAVDEIANELSDYLVKLAKQNINLTNIRNRTSSDSSNMYSQWSRESLYGLRGVIQDMVNTRLFTGRQQMVKGFKINRYDLTELSPNYQQVIMRIISSRVLAMGVMETKRSGRYNPAYPNHILVADEGKHVKEIASTPLSPINRIATEGRGYGVGVWAGVQSADQVTQDMIKNFSTYFLLRTTEASYAEVSKLFGAPPALLKQLKARENVLYGTGGPYSLVCHFKV